VKGFQVQSMFLVAISISLCSCRSDISSVKDCFNEYKAAILSRNGVKAVTLVDSSTFKLYSGLLEKVRLLDSSQLEKESLATKFEVFKVRHMIESKEINGMDGKQLLTVLINRGISGNGNIESYSLGDIAIKNDSAQAQQLSEKKETPFRYLFIKEGQFWRIRTASSSHAPDIFFKQMAFSGGITVNEYIYKLLEDISRKKPSADIWRPIH